MKVLILAFGTRGDVQPFIALASELRRRGHDAVLAAPARFAGLAAEHGVSFAAVDDGPLRLMDAAHGVGETMTGGIRGTVALARSMPATFGQVLDDATTIATTGPGAGAEVIVHNGQILAAPHLAEKLAIPSVLALTVPVYVPTREFPWPGQAMPARLPAALNRATFAGMKAPAMIFGRTVDRWRDTLGLPRRRGRHDPLRNPDGTPTAVLNAVSRHVVAPPADWPSTVATTGYWFLPARHRDLPADLVAFLADGEPPVFVGFGSMAGPDPAGTSRMVLAAIADAGVRAVLATGWGGITAPADLPDGVFVLDEVPHDLLLPHVAAVVHHGGAGTTGAAAAAGRPQVICPFVADQPFWGRRMHALGVAPAPIDQRRLRADRLAHAITRAVDDPALDDAAGTLGRRIREEDGIDAAVHHLERLVATNSHRR